MFSLKVTQKFFDTKANRLREIGETIVCSAERAEFLLSAKSSSEYANSHYVELVEAAHRSDIKKSGKEIYLSCELLYKIGGIETFYKAFVEKYKDRNITIVVRYIDPKMAVELSEYADIIIDKDNSRHYECDVLLLNHWDTAHTIYGRCKAKEIYHLIHGDWNELKKDRRFVNCEIEKKPDVTYVSVSPTAKKSLKKQFGIDSIVIENPLEPKLEKPMVFLTLSRASEEKGIDNVLEMARRFKNAGKKFVWIICADIEEQRTEDYEEPEWKRELLAMPEFIFVRPSVMNKFLLLSADYLVQLSRHESFCYSAREALKNGVPVILSDFTEASRIVKRGGGYIVKQDLSDLDVDKIFEEIPKVTEYKEPKSGWDAIIEGKERR